LHEFVKLYKFVVFNFLSRPIHYTTLLSSDTVMEDFGGYI